MSNCLICQKQTKKYKCSKCLEFCCSYECYIEHKQNDLCLVLKHSETDCDVTAEEPEPTQHEFKSYDTIPTEVLARLKNAENVKNCLYNPHLRKFLRALDSAPNASRAMENAMQEPIFIEFADECLKIVEPENTLE